MSRMLVKYKNRIIFVLICEFVGFFLAYLIKDSIEILILSIYALIKNSILILLLNYLYSKIKKENIMISDVLGADTGNAFLFGSVGMIIYDEQNYITWVSSLFIELGYDLAGQNLLEYWPDIHSSFEDGSEILKISIDDKIYEVYNNLISRTLYLKEVTILEDLKSAYYGEKVVAGYIGIDNYDETIHNSDEQKAAIVQSTIRTSILEWGKDYGVVIRRYSSETFIVLLNEDAYQSILNSKFKVLNLIKEQANQLGVVLSLSIGIGRKATNLNDLDELAYSALILAISRGGDQVVVKTEGEEMSFFGGSSESLNMPNRLRSRIVAQSLTGILKQSKHILIMGHKESDFDSLGASLAVAKIADLYDIPCNIIINNDSIEEKTQRALRELLKLPEYQKKIISSNVALDLLKDDPLLISVDNHKPSLAIDKRLLEAREVIIIDHHRRGEEFIERPIMTYLEPTASSTIELVSELFEYLNIAIEFSELEATILYTGLLVDTNYFKNRVGARTFAVAATLKRLGSSVVKADEFLEDDYQLTLNKAKIIQSATRFKDDVMIAVSKEKELQSRAFLAKVGNDILSISEINATFIIGRISEEVVAISARSKGNINSQMIMEKLGGGGHFGMAACQINNKSIQEVYDLLCKAIDDYLEERGD